MSTEQATIPGGAPASGFPPGLAFVSALLFVLIMFARMQAAHYLAGADISNDAPYHIAMADNFAAAALAREFHWTGLSLWKDSFYDKELAFHLLLAAWRRLPAVLGLTPPEPPFLLETAFLQVLLLSVFAWVLRGLGVRSFWLYLPVLAFASPLFALRLNMVRPHTLAICLMLAVCLALCRLAGSRRLQCMFGLGVLLAYSYSNPHFILFPCLCLAVLAWPEEKWRSLLPAAAAAGGVLAGMTVHPQFPNTYLVWKVQCVDVILNALKGGLPVTTPNEIKPPDAATVMHNAAVFILPLVAAALWLPKRRLQAAGGRELRFFLLMAGCTAVGFLRSKRVIEYALIFSVAALALALRPYLEAGLPAVPRRRLAWAAGAVLGLSLGMLPLNSSYFREGHIPVPRHFAAWARGVGVPPGSTIANLHWQDFTRLFYAAPEYRYSYGLDPMFAYAANPRRYAAIFELTERHASSPPPSALRELLEADLVFVSFVFADSARRLAAAGCALVYQGPDGWCFDLAAPPVDHRLPAAPAGH